jgi:hypothetical protein
VVNQIIKIEEKFNGNTFQLKYFLHAYNYLIYVAKIISLNTYKNGEKRIRIHSAKLNKKNVFKELEKKIQQIKTDEIKSFINLAKFDEKGVRSIDDH